jgi:hypothetical protein
MAAAGDKVILYGGYDGTNTLVDTWVWDGTAWTQLDVAGPGKRPACSMTSWNDTVLLFGGQYVRGTWQCDGRHWNELDPPTAPSDRTAAGMTWIP